MRNAPWVKTVYINSIYRYTCKCMASVIQSSQHAQYTIMYLFDNMLCWPIRIGPKVQYRLFESMCVLTKLIDSYSYSSYIRS